MPQAPQPSTTILVQEMNTKALQFIEEVTSNAGEVQRRVLVEILGRSAHVEYLTAHNLRGRTDAESFKKAVPVVTYDDISPYIQRIANGDTSPILCSEPISEFLTSSGTSGGERKLMPTIEEELERRSLLYSLLMPVMTQFIPGLETGKGMYFLFIKSEFVTPGGLLARPVLTSYYKSPHFKQRHNDPYTNYTSPNETILCPDSYQSMYSQVLCGLAQRAEVLRVGAVFASGFIRAIKFLENHWEILCNDIRVGIPNSMIVTDATVQEAVKRILNGPDPGLAGSIEAECRKGSWQGVIKRLWPNTKYVDVIVTGAMAQYIPILDYYSGGLPLVCTMYASSECYFGLNLNPLCDPSSVAYTILPNMGYFEFLPLENEGQVQNIIDPSKEGSKTVVEDKLIDLVDVELGKEYELVLTTYAGLYRYRVGDILRVAGFKNQAPQFNFVRRKNVALSVDSDKTDELELQNAVQRAVTTHLSPLNVTLVEYTSYADTTTIPGHYVLFWEIVMGGADVSSFVDVGDHVFEECCLTIEESLNSVYRQCRVCDKSIGALEIRVVESGTFDKLMDYALSLGASINQYKTPRCVKYAPIIELLNSRVVSNYFSRECPKWVPGHKQWLGEN